MSTCCHIPAPKVGNSGDAGFLRNDVRVANLQGSWLVAFRQVKNGLSVAAYRGYLGWLGVCLVQDFKHRVSKEIAEVMGLALNNLYCNDKDCTKFEQTVFVWYCSNDNQDAKNSMYELLDKHIRAVIRKEWEREQEAA